MRDLSVTLIQDATRWHDPAGNMALYGERIAAAPRSDLIVLPETLLSGFSNEAVREAEGMDGVGVAWMRAQAVASGAVVTGSLVIRDASGVYNRMIWAEPNGRVSHYDKRHLFRMAGEHTRYAAGRDRLIVELAGWRICPVVCYDLRFPVFLRNRHDGERFDYDLMVVVANWPSPRRHAWRTLLRARAIENLAYVVGVNRVGTDGNQLTYAGDSAALDPTGEALADLGPQPQSVTVTLSAEVLRTHRERFPAQLDADQFTLHD
ncbi:MAG: amidohydrolase [Xanthomonadales bacterium]|jgi:predicted amidohydrolase|nr:amidohydrolase [Xanthomonadales bacterium]